MERLLFAYAGVGLATGAAALALLALARAHGKAVCRAVSGALAGAGWPRLLVPLQRRCLRPRLSRCWSCRLAAGYGAGGKHRQPAPRARLRGRRKRSVRTAGIDREYGTGNKGNLWNGTGGAAGSGCRRAVCTREGGRRLPGITQNSVLPRSGEILLPAPARLARLCVLQRAWAYVRCGTLRIMRYGAPARSHWNRPMESSAARKAYAAACRAVRMRAHRDICQCRCVPCPMAVGVLHRWSLVPEAPV